MKLRKARAHAMRMLFQWELSKEPADVVKRKYWETAEGAKPAPVRQLADQLYDGVIDRLDELDGLVYRGSPHWRVERMSVVDRNIIRVAICEMLLRPDVHSKIMLTEALEIARDYSSKESRQFINGVLDAVRRLIRSREVPPLEEEPQSQEDTK